MINKLWLSTNTRGTFFVKAEFADERVQVLHAHRNRKVVSDKLHEIAQQEGLQVVETYNGFLHARRAGVEGSSI